LRRPPNARRKRSKIRSKSRIRKMIKSMSMSRIRIKK